MDAAHGKSVGAAGSAQHVDAGRRKVLEARKTAVPCNGRGAECVAVRADFAQDSARGAAVARSRRKIAIAQRNAAEGANNGFTANVNAVTSYGMSGAACGARLRASAAGGCGPHGSKSRTTATANRSPGPAAIVPPRQPYFVILNEVKNLFPCEPKAACGLCLARRRKTNEVQSNICIASIQILRRSSDLLRMTMLSCIEPFRIGHSFKCSPGPAAGVALSARAGPGRKG